MKNGTGVKKATGHNGHRQPLLADQMHLTLNLRIFKTPYNENSFFDDLAQSCSFPIQQSRPLLPKSYLAEANYLTLDMALVYLSSSV